MDEPRSLGSRLVSAYRRSGADLPGSDPRPTHGAEMEGWFWRLTDATRGRVVVALCGVNRHPDGPWATVALAAHPGNVVHSGGVEAASASGERFQVRAGDVLDGGPNHLRVRLGGDELDVTFDDTNGWPLRLGGGGIFSALPFLGQYWHPHVLGGRASGTARVGGELWDLDGAAVYAEKNWGSGFPAWWWWGEAHDFDGDDVCVAFGGGRLRAGPLAFDVGGCVIRVGSRTIRFAPPAAIVRSDVDCGRWNIHARRPGWTVDIDGDGDGAVPHILPVPVPAERRNIETDIEHLAGTMHVTLRHRRRVVFDGTSRLAGLELGTTDAELAVEQRAQLVDAR
jgi:tocopherol cyclase